MHAATTNRTLVTTAPNIIHEFGLGAYVRCMAQSLLSRRPRSFLEVAMRLSAKGREQRSEYSRN
jgi:hypothetical protein